jgi:DNA-binding MarR family transcriptional regulator
MSRRQDDNLVEEIARECIANKIRLLNRAVTALYDQALRPYGLTIGQMSVLVTVSKMGGASPASLTRVLHMEKSTLSRNVQRMRARGWLEARPTEDRRITELRASARGLRLLREAHPAWSRAQHRARGMLGAHGLRGIAQSVAQLP